MIIFHEGLPRSGKSYEATKEHILPALKKRRKVFARINGLNHEKFAELAELTLEECQSLLIHITPEQVPEIYKHVENDSLVIIDELQNFFPSGRVKLSEDMTKFVTEHGHRGLDIIAMGQSLSDCHNIWRRRTQRKLQFLKLDMLGQEKRYKWTAYQGSLKADGEITFTKINSGVKSYDPTFFGTYASHQDETNNKDNLADDRLNLLKTGSIKYGLPAAAAVGVFAVWYLFQFFNAPSVTKEPKQTAQTVDQGTQPGQVTPQKTTAKNVKVDSKPARPKDWDFVQEMTEKFTPRLSYLSAQNGFIMDALVVWMDDSDRVKDQVYYDALKDLGYKIQLKPYGLKITKGEWVMLARWPIIADPFGAVPQTTREKLNE